MLESKKPSQFIKKLQSNEVELNVHFLDETTHKFSVKKRCSGAEFLHQVFDYLNLNEREFFGIQILPYHHYAEFVNWVDPSKPLLKHIVKDDRQLFKLQFRVKFFATDPSQLQEECTRHQFYLQIRRDIYLGKLNCPLSTQYLLSSYIVQAELGDYDSLEHDSNYLHGLKLIPNQNDEMEFCISEHHKLHRGLECDDAIQNYLEHATKIPLYGIYFFKSKDSTGKDIELGVTSCGMIVFQIDHIVNEFSWAKMLKISFKRRTFFIELKRELTEDYNTMLGFKMSSHKHAKAVWKCCVEYHSFFRLNRTAKSTSKQSKSYFTACTDTVQTTKDDDQSRKQFTKLAKISQTIAENRLNEKVCHITNAAAVTAAAAAAAAATAPPATTTTINGSSTHSGNGNGHSNGNGKLSLLSITKSYKTYDNKVTSKQIETIPRMAWEQQMPTPPATVAPQSLSAAAAELMHSAAIHLNDKNLITVCMEADEHGRFGFNVRGGIDVNLPVLVARIAPHSPADRVTPKIKEGDKVLLINGHDVSGLTHTQVVNLIKATREHNPHGQLVLTIKPGIDETITLVEEEEPICQYVPDNYIIDQHHPHPKAYDDAIFTQSLFLLRDGLASGALLEQFEQLYKRNDNLSITEAKKDENAAKNRYRDILPYDCNRVVIANTADTQTDYINANYVNMMIPNDCVNRYIATQGPMQNTIVEFWRMVQQESSNFIVMLTTIIERGRVKCAQYWPALNEEMQLSPTFSIKLLSELSDSADSYVLRKIALSDSTTGEYRVIRQLQYLAWPDHGVPSDQTLFMHFVDKMREMRQETVDSIDHRFKQLQILDADASDISPEEICKRSSKIDDNDDDAEDDQWIPTSVHQYISAANPPIIVHCSAGIGRTGMLILMDTAISLLNVNEPVYPLDIVKNMRDQRPSMVQNVFQYKFICECIFAKYAKLTKTNVFD